MFLNQILTKNSVYKQPETYSLLFTLPLIFFHPHPQQPTRHTTADSAHPQQQHSPSPVLHPFHPSGTTPPAGAPLCCFPVFPLLGLPAQPVPTLRGHAVQAARNAQPDARWSDLTQVRGNEEEEGRKRGGGGDGT